MKRNVNGRQRAGEIEIKERKRDQDMRETDGEKRESKWERFCNRGSE